MVAQSTAVSISISGSGFTVTWSGSSSADQYAFYIYISTTEVGTYSLLTSDSISGGSMVTSGTHLVSYNPTGEYYYRAVVTTGGGTPEQGTSQSLCTPVLYAGASAVDFTSTINLTMSCISTIFSESFILGVPFLLTIFHSLSLIFIEFG
jgi:hypothetical protein